MATAEMPDRRSFREGDARPVVRAVGGLSGEAAVAALERLTGKVRQAERCIADAVLAAAEVARSGVCERLEGMPLELWLANACRLIGSDRHTIISCSETLESMPVLAGLFATGRSPGDRYETSPARSATSPKTPGSRWIGVSGRPRPVTAAWTCSTPTG